MKIDHYSDGVEIEDDSKRGFSISTYTNGLGERHLELAMSAPPRGSIDYGDGDQYLAMTISKEEVPEMILALQTWIERIQQTEEV